MSTKAATEITTVRYIGMGPWANRWGGCTDPDAVLEIGKTYRLIDVDEHSWHTRFTLEGVNGEFNSVGFEEVSP